MALLSGKGREIAACADGIVTFLRMRGEGLHERRNTINGLNVKNEEEILGIFGKISNSS